METEGTAKIRPEVLAAITAAITLYSGPGEQPYRVASVSKISNPWRKAGILENMRNHEIRKSAGR